MLTHPSQYASYLAALAAGDVPAALRRKLAIAAFERTAEYDVAISHYLAAAGEVLPSALPGALALTLPLAKRLRYGTNPQARAAFYLDRPDRLPEQLHGKALCYNNLLDLDATLRLLSRAPLGAEFGSRHERYVRAAVVKHTVPCGVAQRSTRGRRRFATRSQPIPTSAYGGIVATDAADRRRGGRVARAVLSGNRGGAELRRCGADAAEKEEKLAADALRHVASRRAGGRTAGAQRARRRAGRERRSRGAAGGVAVVSRRHPSDRNGTTCVRVGRRAARQVQRHRDRQGRDDARHLRRPNQSRQRGRIAAGRAGALPVPRARATASFRLPTAWKPRPPEAAPRSSLRADRCAMPR